MADTGYLGLPLLTAAQAQKHVTVNEAFLRLDTLTQLTLQSFETVTPPNSPKEGEAWAVPAGANGSWAANTGDVAMFLNGGWAFLPPQTGWRCFVSDRGVPAFFDGTDWVEGAGSLTPSGAGFLHRSLEFDHDIAAGATSVVAAALQAQSIVYGITGRVLNAIGGAASFQIGVAGSANRYGSGFGTGAGSWTRGITGNPLAYYADTDVVLTADGGVFDGTGTLRLAIHFAELSLPSA